MTLNLYNYFSKSDVENVFDWEPDEEQWWITGFDPAYMNPDHNKMVSLGSVDYTGCEELFNALKSAVQNDLTLKDYMIFDENGHTVWLVWWNK